ncbi:unnamed protein product, partial [Mesorhabditis belari]|uniref:Uncharacterized protein n=1 Tax=Mesorhabditis belari TaxID=2138241 RepID=A0AAF3FEN5_9BILA
MSSKRRMPVGVTAREPGGSAWPRGIMGDSASDSDSGCVLDEFAWTPPKLTPHMVHLYFACLPEDKVPYTNSVGEKWRERQLRSQLPPQDSDPLCCGPLTRSEEKELKGFDEARKRRALGRGRVERTPYDGSRKRCAGCDDAPLEEGQVAVYAEKVDRWFHPACFSCHKCQALLVDLVYFTHGNTVFCGRHHAEQLKPRCAKCDELVFGDEVVEAEERHWHHHHFTCAQCQRPLGGSRYVSRSGRFMCLGCDAGIVHPKAQQYPAISGDPSFSRSPQFPGECAGCHQIIHPNQPHIAQGDQRWHTTSECFSCHLCQRSLLGMTFEVIRGNPQCKPQCSFNHLQTPSTSRKMMTEIDERKHFGHLGRRRGSVQGRDDRDGQLNGRNHPVDPPHHPIPPRTAPPPPPSEGIYETVLALPLPLQKKSSDRKHRSGRPKNLYSSTPNQLRRTDSEPLYDRPFYSTSSDSSDDDDVYYMQHMMAAASLAVSHKTLPNDVKKAKRRKQSRCIVS